MSKLKFRSRPRRLGAGPVRAGHTRLSGADLDVIPGTSTLLEEHFDDDQAGLTTRAWYDQGGDATISTTEAYGGSGGSLQATFNAGSTNPSWVRQRHLITPTDALYIGYRVKYSTNWVGSGQNYHPHEWFALSDQDGDAAPIAANILNCYIEHNYSAAAGGLVPQFQMQDNLRINYVDEPPLPNNLIGDTELRSTCGCNGIMESPAPTFVDCYPVGGGAYYSAKVFRAATAAIVDNVASPNYKNLWNHVEVFMRMNSVVGGIGLGDGILQYWVNNALVLSFSNIVYRTGAHPTLKWKQIVVAPYIGDTSPVTQTSWFDALVVANARPAPPVTPPGTNLAFVQVPVNTLEDTTITPPVRVGVQDDLGNLVPGATHVVTLAKASGPGIVAGTLVRAAVGGIATFNDLSVNDPGDYAVQATAVGLTPVTSPVFTIDPVPGGPTPWPNEPPGGTLISDYGFDDVMPTTDAFIPYAAGWDRGAFEPGDMGGFQGMIRVEDATDPQSPPYGLQFNYPQGFRSDGSEPGKIFRSVGGGNGIYFGVYWKASNPWHNHQSSINKILFQFLGGSQNSGGGGQVYLFMLGSGGHLRTMLELTGVTTQQLAPNVNTTNATLGVQHRVEWFMRKSPSLLQWWLDGVLQGQYTNVNWPGNSFDTAEICPVWGGSGGPTKAQNDWFRFGHVRLKRY